MAKPKVGFFGITGCAGCLLSVLFNEDDLIDMINAVDITAFPFIKEKNSEGPFDIVFIEGTVVSNDDVEHLKEIVSKATTVVALGTCSCFGNIPAMRDESRESDIQPLLYEKKHQNQDIGKPVPINKVVKVDYYLPGCPPDRNEIKKFIKQILLGMTFRPYPDPVCKECKLYENGCLLDNNIICLGPLVRGGCGAICTTGGLKCYGCRGLTDDANFDEFFALMAEKGFSEKDVKKILDTFMKPLVDEKLKGTKWEQLR